MASSVNDFIAGYISGVAGLIIGSPLDVLKVRLQAQGDSALARNAAADKNRLTSMVQNEGVRSLFKGISSPIVGLAGLNSILFASYSATMRALETYSPSSGEFQPLSHVFTAGFVAGVACFLVSTPTELVKCRAQIMAAKLDQTLPLSTQRALLSESGSWNVAKDVVRRFGIRGLYQGGWVTILRDAPGYGVYFLGYEWLKRVLDVPNGETGGINTWKLLFAGGMAGTLSWASIYPLDVIKTRLQTQPHLMGNSNQLATRISAATVTANTGLLANSVAVTASPSSNGVSVGGSGQSTRQRHAGSGAGSALPYRGIVDCAIRSYKSEGLGVFMKGATPALLRAFPVNAVTFFVYELVMAELQRLEQNL
ncbi:hypothetical protein BGZ73_006920 [Actinomortierella ambigua]|nr:hypothetical protein BGZ73_006920 [Actinomortierella ambigua]